MPHPIREILAASAIVCIRHRRCLRRFLCLRYHPAVGPDRRGFARRHGRIRRLARRSSGCAPDHQATRLGATRLATAGRGRIGAEFRQRSAPHRSKANRPKRLRSQPICLRSKRAAHHSRGAQRRRVRRREQRGAHPRVAAERQERGTAEPIRHRACTTRSASRSIRPEPIHSGSMSAIPMRWWRFPYRNGDRAARGPAEVVVPAFAGRRPQHPRRGVLAGRQNNVRVGRLQIERRRRHGKAGRGGAAGVAVQSSASARTWGDEDRARRCARFRSGRQEPSASSQPASAIASVWRSPRHPARCGARPTSATASATMCRPITSLACREGAFYGWPWYYIGAHQDPRHSGERPDLNDKITVPEVLIQAHSASLGMTFYDATAIPGRIPRQHFRRRARLWNRSKRTGYKIIRVPVRNGAPTGEYEISPPAS